MLQAALEQAVTVEPLERKLRDATKAGTITADYLPLQVEQALDTGILDQREADCLMKYHEAVAELVAVDDFDNDEIARMPAGQPVKASVTRLPTKKTAKKKTAKKATTKKKTATRKTAAKKKKTSVKTVTDKPADTETPDEG